MKKILVTIFLLSLPLTAMAQAWNPWNPGLSTMNTSGFAPANQPFCNTSGCTYIPLEPLPNSQFNSGGYTSLASYLNAIFTTLLSLAALFAVTMLTISGIQYMVSESGYGKEQAKKHIKASLWGLLLLTASWLILNTINPELLNFKISNVPAQGTVTNVPAGQSSPYSSGSGNGPGGSTFVNGAAGPSVGTATGDQLRAASEALGVSSISNGVYLLVDPTKIDADAQYAIDQFKKNCETEGILNTVLGSYYTTKQVPGSIFGVSNETAYMCV